MEKHYHNIPINNKNLFDEATFRTIALSTSQGISAVISKLKNGPRENPKIYKYLFDVNKWDMDKAKTWVKDHDAKDIEYAVNLFLLFENKYNIKSEDGVLDDIEEAVNTKAPDLDDNVSFFNWNTEEEKQKIDSMEINKDSNNETILNCINIQKKDEMKRLVYGIVYQPDKADWHKHFMTKEEIETAAHFFLLNSRGVDEQHDYINGSGGIAESFIARKGDPDFPEGAWVLVTKVFSDTVWKDIMAGKIKAYSMAGMANFGDEKEVDTDIDFPDEDQD